MFDSMRKHVDNTAGNSEIETIIGKETVFTGQISGSGSLRIDGRVDGGISVSGNVVIGENGIVVGDISANSLLISGSVTGNVAAEEKLTILATGQLVGDIRCHQFNVMDGGVFQGRSEMAPRVNVTVAPAM